MMSPQAMEFDFKRRKAGFMTHDGRTPSVLN